MEVPRYFCLKDGDVEITKNTINYLMYLNI